MRTRILALVAALLLGAPAFAAAQAAPAADVAPQADVAWLLIGVTPDFARLTIEPAEVKKGVVRFHFSLTPPSYYPKDGFVLIRAQPDQLYAISESALMWGRPLIGQHYLPCGQTATFRAPGGRVTYFASFDYQVAGARPVRTMNGYELKARGDVTQDLDGARAFLKANYPGLADSLAQGTLQNLPVVAACR